MIGGIFLHRRITGAKRKRDDAHFEREKERLAFTQTLTEQREAGLRRTLTEALEHAQAFDTADPGAQRLYLVTVLPTLIEQADKLSERQRVARALYLNKHAKLHNMTMIPGRGDYLIAAEKYWPLDKAPSTAHSESLQALVGELIETVHQQSHM